MSIRDYDYTHCMCRTDKGITIHIVDRQISGETLVLLRCTGCWGAKTSPRRTRENIVIQTENEDAPAETDYARRIRDEQAAHPSG